MSELKQELSTILNSEAGKIAREKDNKLNEIQNNFKRIMQLAQDHIARGSGYQVNQVNEAQAIEEFEKQSIEYEQIVGESNEQKQQLRNEIAQLEIELRRLRDQVADKQIENKNLTILLQREEQLNKDKINLEERALTTLKSDLEDQLSELQSNAEKITGRVTPFGMEQVLQDKFRKTTTAYKAFIEESEKDLDETHSEAERLRKEYEKEKLITDSLQHEVDINQAEIDKLSEQFKKQKNDLDQMNFEHDQKLKELEQIRLKANEEIKKLSFELSQAQSEINILILESQKYESQLEFLTSEREMILKAQLDGEDIDPYYQSVDLKEAEDKRMRIEEEIANLNREWFGKLESVKEETEKVLSDNEMREFRSRIAILAAELNDKNNQIEQISKEKAEMERVAEKAVSMGMQISDQSQEIDELNERYKNALRDKVDVYDELVESLKELVSRNSRFMRNEIEICRLTNETAIMKRELEQKEKYIEDLMKDIENNSSNQEKIEIQKRIAQRIDEKQEVLKSLRQDVNQLDNDIEFLVLVGREKARNEIQGQNLEQSTIYRREQSISSLKSREKEQEYADILANQREQIKIDINDDEEERKSQGSRIKIGSRKA